MAKDKRPTKKSVSAILIAMVAIILAAYLGTFESLGAWARQVEPGELGGLLAVSIVLAAALGFYSWRGRSQLRRATTRHEHEIAELRRTVEALQRNVAAYRGVVANLPVALFAVDPEGMFTLTEGTGLELLSLQPERVIGRSIFETYRHAPQVVESVRLALGGQASAAIVEVGGRAFETHYSPLRENGAFAGVLGVATDVTERRLAEERLQEAEVRYRTLVEQIPAIAYVEELSKNGKVLTYMSPQYQAMFGHAPQEGVSHPEHWLDVVHPGDRERVLAEDRRTDETLEPFRAEYRVIAKDGRVVWVSDEAVLVRGERGEPLFWQGVMHDITERKRAEEKLREAEERYRTLVEQTPAGVYIQKIEHEGVIAYISPHIEKIVGYTPEEYMADPALWVETTHPADRERVLAEDARTDETGEPFKMEFRKITRDGRVIWVRDEAVLVRDAEDRPLHWQGIFVDITERKEAEEALKESERRLSTLLANAPAFLYRCRNEPGWPNEFVSDYAEELTGHTPAELTDGTVLFGDLIVEEDRERVWNEVQEALAERRRFALRYAILHKDGERRHVEEHGQGVYGEDGDVEAIEGVVHDVTERVRAEEALRKAEERYRTLIEQIPAVTYIDRATDGSEEPLYTSPQIEEMLGYTPEEWLGGRLWPERLHPDDKERVLAADERFEAGSEERFSEEYRLIAKDESVVWVREEAVALKDEAGEPLYWQGVIFDITERKEAEERLRVSESELRALFAAMSDIVLELDDEGRYLKIAPTNPSLLYRPPEELLGKTIHEVLPTHTADMLLGHIRRALEERRKVDIEYSLPIDDEQRWFAGTISPMSQARVVFVARDVTERKEAEDALKRSEATLAGAQRIAHVGSWEWDPGSGALSWSDETFRIYGLEPQSFVPTVERLLETVHPDDRRMLTEALEAALEEGEPYDFEHRVVRPDGEVRVVHRRAEVVRDESGEPLKMVGTVHDITERKALEERLEQQALHDPLTGLPNRVLFTNRLGHALRGARRRRRPLAVLFMDLDNFKVINDSLGHRAGDRVLMAVSKRVRKVLRPEDTVARLGGDEFIFLLEDTDVAGAARVAERVLEHLRAPFPLGGRRLFVTASVGIALGGAGEKQAADLLRDADLAMYQAKHAGKARYAVFEEGMNARALERLELEHDLRRALERGEFRVDYQPKVSLENGRIVGFEALVRWEHPERGLLLPDDFIPVAEEAGLIVRIGEAVLEEACRRTKEWQERFPFDPPLDLCVNLSARQFREPDLAEIVARILAETELDPTCLHLEITESTAMGDAPATVATLEKLKNLGVCVIIDDFGTGYSSLSYLGRFPVDYVKIDRSFVAKLGEDPGATALVSGMTRLAHSLGLEIIAEGVETEEQLGQLQELGCDSAQGYYFSEPLTSEAVSALLEINAPSGISRPRTDWLLPHDR